MQIVPRIKQILDSKPDEEQLDKFIADLRDGLATSSKQFISFGVLLIAALATYHLVVYEGVSGVTLNSIPISNVALFRRVFLIVPAALLGVTACIGYLRRWQREIYDYLAISRCSVLAQTGLHELRLPPDYILGLFILAQEGGSVGKLIARTMTVLLVIVFVYAPAIYIVHEAVRNVLTFGISDLMTLSASGISIILCLCSLIIVHLAGHIQR